MWYYISGDDEKGPISAEEFLSLATQGIVGPQTYVWKDGMPDWKLAGEVGELYSGSPQPAARPTSSATPGGPDLRAAESPFGETGPESFQPQVQPVRHGQPGVNPHGHHRRQMPPEGGGIILALGLLGLLFCQLFGIAAWIMGNTHIETARRMGVQPDGTAVAGRICGIIAVILLVVTAVVFGFIMVLAAAGAAM